MPYSYNKNVIIFLVIHKDKSKPIFLMNIYVKILDKILEN